MGVPRANVQFHVADAGGSAVLSTSGTSITIDPDYLRGATRQDLQGALVHELTHAYQQVPGGYTGAAGKLIEPMADYARATLTHTPGWTASPEVRQLLHMAPGAVRRMSTALANGTYKPGMYRRAEATVRQPNGPRQDPTTGRLDQAATNTRSKNGGFIPSGAPAIGASQSQALTQSLAAAQSSYMNALADIRAKGGSIRGQYQSAVADIRTKRIGDMAAAESGAIANGIIGSSSDLTNRAGVIAGAKGSRIDARTARSEAIGALQVQKMQAGTDYQTQLANISQQKAAAEADLQAQRFQNGLMAQQQASYQDLYQAALKKLLAQGKNPHGVDPRAGAGLAAANDRGGAPAGPWSPYGPVGLTGPGQQIRQLY